MMFFHFHRQIAFSLLRNSHMSERARLNEKFLSVSERGSCTMEICFHLSLALTPFCRFYTPSFARVASSWLSVAVIFFISPMLQQCVLPATTDKRWCVEPVVEHENTKMINRRTSHLNWTNCIKAVTRCIQSFSLKACARRNNEINSDFARERATNAKT